MSNLHRPWCQRHAAGATRLLAVRSPLGTGLGKSDWEREGPHSWTWFLERDKDLGGCYLVRNRFRKGERGRGWVKEAPWEVGKGAVTRGADLGSSSAQNDPASSAFVPFLSRYWEDFHSCTVTALTDCQEGAKDMWDKLRKESKNLNIQGSLFELCGSSNGAAGSLLPALSVLLVSLSAALATWFSF